MTTNTSNRTEKAVFAHDNPKQKNGCTSRTILTGKQQIRIIRISIYDTSFKRK
jgi:hypothetical protein